MERTYLTNKEFKKIIKDDSRLHEMTFPIKTQMKDGSARLETRYNIITESQLKMAQRQYEKRRREIMSTTIPGVLIGVASGSSCDKELNNAVGYHRIVATFKNKEGKAFWIDLQRCFNKPKGFFMDMAKDLEKEAEYERICKEIHEYNKDKQPAFRKSYPDQFYYLDREAYNNGPNIEMPFTKENVLVYINSRFKCDYKDITVYSGIITSDEVTSIC